MTKRLILIRHAKSSWKQPGPDHARPLNNRGYISAQMIGDWLRDRHYWPQDVLCSSARRTVETCAHIGFDADIHYLDSLYHASPEDMLDELQHATADVVAMIGHNPGIGELASQLVDRPPQHPRFFDYPTCATAIIDFPTRDWRELRTHSGTLVDFVIPRELT